MADLTGYEAKGTTRNGREVNVKTRLELAKARHIAIVMGVQDTATRSDLVDIHLGLSRTYVDQHRSVGGLRPSNGLKNRCRGRRFANPNDGLQAGSHGNRGLDLTGAHQREMGWRLSEQRV